jgi:hypothetical protein
MLHKDFSPKWKGSKEIMAVFEFNAFIDVEADTYDEAIENFDFMLKHGSINRSNVYVAEIEEK